MFNNLLELKKEIDISKIEQIQEIKLNEKLKEELSKLFSEEEKGFVKINDCTSIIKTDKNYVFFSNQYFYLAILCKNYAESLYAYCDFFDRNIRNANELNSIVLKQDFTSKRYIELFEDKNDEELFTKFLIDENYRPGKKFINGIEDKSFRGTKDLFSSCILKMLPLPDASSGYFGSIVYYLSKRKVLFNELENFYRGEDKKEQYSISYFYNRIIFGAPGTGKSYRLENQRKKFLKHYERVTFHPNYSYSQFVGCYKPTMKSVQTVDGEKEEIIYSFVPGPFLRVYVNAIRNSGENFLLLIEEINRANVAAVFGDVFQLLDRRDGKSEYPVTAGEDIIKYLESEGIKQSELSIPKNMFIWATMNSADQGVFPMDTAFKRRWNFEYIGIDENESGVSDYAIPISRKVDEKKIIKKVNWNKLRQAINKKLISLNVNEDKLLGPYFIGKKDLENAMQKQEDFIKLFKSKVLMYLFEDAAKMKRNFFNCEKYIYSEICKEFDEKGIEVFNFSDEEKGELKELDISQTPETSEPALE